MSEQSKIHANIIDNIKSQNWTAVWHDSWLLDGGQVIRRQLHYDADADTAEPISPINISESILTGVANKAFSGIEP